MSMLDEAKQFVPDPPKPRNANTKYDRDEVLDLAFGYLGGEVTATQVKSVMKGSVSNLGSYLIAAARRGDVSIIDNRG